MAMELLTGLDLDLGETGAEVARDVERVRTGIVNAFLVGEPGAGDRGCAPA